MTHPGLAAVVVAHGGADLARAAIAALKAEGVGVEAIWLVDAASPEGIPEALQAALAPGRLLALPENQGFAQALNLGVAAALAAGAEWLWVQNHDAALRPGALAALQGALAAEGRLAVVAPRRWEGGAEAPPLGRYRPALGWVAWAQGPPGEEVGLWPSEVLSAAGWLMRAKAWQGVGPMDEGCFLYHEDVDWCLRARQAGWALAVAPGAWLDHVRGAATGARPGGGKPPLVDHLEWRNAWWLAGRHSPGWRGACARAIALGLRWPAKALRVAWRGPAPRRLVWWALWTALGAAWRQERGRPRGL